MSAYALAGDAFERASSALAAAREAYRAGEIDKAELVAERTRYAAACRSFDEAFKADMLARPPEPHTTGNGQMELL